MAYTIVVMVTLLGLLSECQTDPRPCGRYELVHHTHYCQR